MCKFSRPDLFNNTPLLPWRHSLTDRGGMSGWVDLGALLQWPRFQFTISRSPSPAFYHAATRAPGSVCLLSFFWAWSVSLISVSPVLTTKAEQISREKYQKSSRLNRTQSKRPLAQKKTQNTPKRKPGEDRTIRVWFSRFFTTCSQETAGIYCKGKGKGKYTWYSASSWNTTSEALRYGSYSVTCKLHRTCLGLEPRPRPYLDTGSCNRSPNPNSNHQNLFGSLYIVYTSKKNFIINFLSRANKRVFPLLCPAHS